jgi:hypothetical protein
VAQESGVGGSSVSMKVGVMAPKILITTSMVYLTLCPVGHEVSFGFGLWCSSCRFWHSLMEHGHLPLGRSVLGLLLLQYSCPVLSSSDERPAS